LSNSTAANELTWTRTVYALTPIETIAFAAVGWLFGREVHRQEAEHAQIRATNAEARADSANDDAAKAHSEAARERSRGTALFGAVLGSQAAPPQQATADGGVVRDSRGDAVPPASASSLDLVRVARLLYPELVPTGADQPADRLWNQ
jgi:hypothetical protein